MFNQSSVTSQTIPPLYCTHSCYKMAKTLEKNIPKHHKFTSAFNSDATHDDVYTQNGGRRAVIQCFLDIFNRKSYFVHLIWNKVLQNRHK